MDSLFRQRKVLLKSIYPFADFVVDILKISGRKTMKKTKKRILSIVLSVVMIAAVYLAMPMTAMAAGPYTADATASTEAELLAAVAAAPTDGITQYVIEITASFDLNAVVVIPVKANIVLISDGDYTLTTQSKGSPLYSHLIPPGSPTPFRHFKVSGWDGTTIFPNTSFTLTDGITLTNC